MQAAWDTAGAAAYYDYKLVERLRELRDLIANRLGRRTEPEPFFDEICVRRLRPHAPWVEFGPHVNMTEAIRQALRKLGLKALPSYLAGLTRLRQRVRRLGVRRFGFFGQAKVDGRNNP